MSDPTPEDPQPMDPNPNVPLPDPQTVDTPAEAVNEMNQNSMESEALTGANEKPADPDAGEESTVDDPSASGGTLPEVDPNETESLPGGGEGTPPIPLTSDSDSESGSDSS